MHYARSTRFPPLSHFRYFTDFMCMQVVIKVTRTPPSSSRLVRLSKVMEYYQMSNDRQYYSTDHT